MNDDLISRQAAIDVICNDVCCGRDGCKHYPECENLTAIWELPSAQPERKKGKWIHDGCNFKGGIDWMHCSECGHKDSWSAITRTPFCGWCGTRMVQEGEDNERA